MNTHTHRHTSFHAFITVAPECTAALQLSSLKALSPVPALIKRDMIRMKSLKAGKTCKMIQVCVCVMWMDCVWVCVCVFVFKGPTARWIADRFAELQRRQITRFSECVLAMLVFKSKHQIISASELESFD